MKKIGLPETSSLLTFSCSCVDEFINKIKYNNNNAILTNIM